jgi:NAD-dependent dihydropyrimidine dehydrogenase PreA subunit
VFCWLTTYRIDANGGLDVPAANGMTVTNRRARRNHMSRPIINAEECTGCGICVDTCENGVIEITRDRAAVVNEDDCTACGDCMEECPMGAIEDVEED